MKTKYDSLNRDILISVLILKDDIIARLRKENLKEELVEGIDAYHESLREGARRERERILKLIDEKIKHHKQNSSNLGNISERQFDAIAWVLEELKEELEK